MNQNKDRDVNIVGACEDMKKNESKNPEKREKEHSKDKLSFSDKHDTLKEYLDFELEINTGSRCEYPVTSRSQAGEAHEIMHFPYEELALEKRLQTIQEMLQVDGKARSSIQDERIVQDFGKELFDSLFVGEIRNRFDVSLERARMENKGVRLKLRIRPPELAALPWEILFDKRQAEYLCLTNNILVLRYLEIPQTIKSLAVKPPLRILGMIAMPGDLDALDIYNEKRWIENATKKLQEDGLVEVTWLEGQTWRDLAKAMRTGTWHVFHFIGHGEFDKSTGKGLVALAGEDGQTHLFSAVKLGRLLADHPQLRLVILNSCKGGKGSEVDLFSSTASILIQRGIPAVLAMQYKISDKAAIEFSRSFYEAIADGLPVDAAAAEARKAISIAGRNSLEWITPVVYMRSPDGKIFDMKDTLDDVRGRLAVENEVDEFRRYRRIRDAQTDSKISQIRNESDFDGDEKDIELWIQLKKAKNEVKEGRNPEKNHGFQEE